MTRLRIGTRGSALALWQSRHIAGRLALLVPDVAIGLKAELAAIAARASYLTMAGSGIGLLPKDDAIALLTPLSSAVRAHFCGWTEYAEYHERGEKLDKTNNAIGRKLLREACRRLQSEAASPWVLFPFDRYRSS